MSDLAGMRAELAISDSARSLRGALLTGVSVALAEPGLWLLGACGFLLRGGWLLLALPVWTFPSPVEMTTLLGAQTLGTGGFTPGLGTLIGALVVVGAIALALSVVGAALTELAAFEHLLREPETVGLRGGFEARKADRAERRAIIGRLAAVYGAALIPVGIAIAVATAFVVQAAYEEFLLPGALEVPLVVRIAARVPGPLLAVGLTLLLAEGLAAPLSRFVVARGFGLEGRRRTLAAAGSRVPAVATLVIASWSITLALVVPGLAAALLGWQAVRDLLLAPDALDGTESAVIAGGATLLFVFLWAAALLLAGLSSALRAALWSAWWLAEFGPRAVTPEDAAASS